MSDEQNISHALDFMTIFADGVALQYSSQVCRLLFYDEAVDVENMNGSDKLDAKKSIRLRAEVRIHRVPLINLGVAINKARELQDKMADDVQHFPQDPEIQHALQKALRDMEALIVDSGDRNLTVASLGKLQDDLDSLTGLVQREDSRRKAIGNK
jgi:hypothetical protein